MNIAKKIELPERKFAVICNSGDDDGAVSYSVSGLVNARGIYSSVTKCDHSIIVEALLKRLLAFDVEANALCRGRKTLCVGKRRGRWVRLQCNIAGSFVAISIHNNLNSWYNPRLL